MTKKLYLYFLCIGLGINSMAQELIEKDYETNNNMVIIKAISSTKKTFVIRLGKEDGILPGQISMFSTKNISILARAITVNRDFSQWIVVEKDSLIPFSDNQVVTLSKSVERIWTELPILQIQEKYRQIEERYARVIGKKHLTIKANFVQGFKESTSLVDEEIGKRSGVHFEAIYSKNYTSQFELGAGLRYDSEVLQKEQTNLDIPTTRLLVMLEGLYHFRKMKNSNTNFYGGVSVGIGKSSTVVDEEEKSGSAWVLPSVKVGALMELSRSYSFLVEGVLESITSKESFSDGKAQDNNIVAAGLTIGLKF